MFATKQSPVPGSAESSRRIAFAQSGDFDRGLRLPSGSTPPLSRAGRKAAEAVLAAANFGPTADGKRWVRQFEVHGIAVTEWVDASKAPDSDRT